MSESSCLLSFSGDTEAMLRPLYEKTELFSIGRIISALLIISGGIALLAQAYFVDLLPRPDGFINTTATVLDLERIGSFQSPEFLVTLEFHITPTIRAIDTVRSGQRVAFEQYFELAVGDVVHIYYNPDDVSEWKIHPQQKLSQYGLGILMLVFGTLSLVFPSLINWASRRDDFEFKEQLDDELVGANTN